uniref:Glucagon like peptide 2 receptor n=1 Tax=Hippocampus comes TaxID=109280 RepID=A0A3Q2XBA2_HIPCM
PGVCHVHSIKAFTNSIIMLLLLLHKNHADGLSRATTNPLCRIYCKGTFDTFVCWPHSAPGNVSVPCPPYLPWISMGNAHRECLENGKWRQKENSSEPWRDDSECQGEHYFKDKEEQMLRQTALRVVSIIGYSLSLASLVFATLLMGMFRKLHCTRNYIHMNLFVSFILRAVAVISKEIILYIMYSNLPKDDPGWNSYSSSPISLMCKFSKVAMEYFVACNYFWLLVEAIFLHTLLFTVIIFFIFIKILLLLLSKLKADQVKFTDYRYSLAKATLVLIPLLGIHEVVFTVLVDECMEGNSRYARDFINLTLSSFQVRLIMLIACLAMFVSSNSDKNTLFFDRGSWLECCIASRTESENKCQSLSSSDGEITLGETMEEILEESEF